jgi:hypothetical protein
MGGKVTFTVEVLTTTRKALSMTVPATHHLYDGRDGAISGSPCWRVAWRTGGGVAGRGKAVVRSESALSSATTFPAPRRVDVGQTGVFSLYKNMFNLSMM